MEEEKVRSNKKWKTVILVSLIASIAGVAIAFAALSQQLNISGNAKIGNAAWDIRFDNLRPNATIIGATNAIDGTPQFDVTSISNARAKFLEAGSVSWTVDVKNFGTTNAKIGTLNLLSPPTVTGTGTSKTADEALCSGKISTSLTYVSSNAPVAVTDTLASGESKTMEFKISFAGATPMPQNVVNVSNLGATLVYTEA